MNDKTKEHVINLLEGYSERERQIALLRYEMGHPAHVTQDDVITALAFKHSGEVCGSTGNVSNNTFYTALDYQSEYYKLNSGTAGEILTRLCELEREQDKLRYYVSLLPERQGAVITLTYFESLPTTQVVERMQVTSKTLNNLKNAAIDALVVMYEFIVGNR